MIQKCECCKDNLLGCRDCIFNVSLSNNLKPNFLSIEVTICGCCLKHHMSDLITLRFGPTRFDKSSNRRSIFVNNFNNR